MRFLSRLREDQRGEISPGFRFLLIFMVLAFITVEVGLVLYVKYSVEKGAQDAATAAATELFSSRNLKAGRSIAVSVAEQNNADLSEFTVNGSTVRVRLDHHTQLESLSKLKVIQHYIVTTATAEAVISRGNGGILQ